MVGPSGATSRVVRNKQDETSTTTAADGTVTQSKALDDGLWGMLLPQGETTVTTPEGLVRYTKTTRSVTLTDPLNPFSVATETATTETNTPDCALGAACPRRTWQKVYNASTRTVTTTTPAGRSFVESLDARGRSDLLAALLEGYGEAPTPELRRRCTAYQLLHQFSDLKRDALLMEPPREPATLDATLAALWPL